MDLLNNLNLGESPYLFSHNLSSQNHPMLSLESNTFYKGNIMYLILYMLFIRKLYLA